MRWPDVVGDITQVQQSLTGKRVRILGAVLAQPKIQKSARRTIRPGNRKPCFVLHDGYGTEIMIFRWRQRFGYPATCHGNRLLALQLSIYLSDDASFRVPGSYEDLVALPGKCCIQPL